MPSPCTVKIFGLVSRHRADGTHYPLPFGTYTLQQVSPTLCRVSSGTPPEHFEFTPDEVARYMGRQMKLIEGTWPPSLR